MSWSYSGDPSVNLKDAVRFLSGDTNINTPLASDEEIRWLLSKNNNDEYRAAIAAIESFLPRYAQTAGSSSSKSVGDLSLSSNTSGAQIQQFQAILARLKLQMSTRPAVGWAGQVNQADRENDAENDALVQPSFSVGQMDDTATGDEFDIRRNQ